MREFLFWVFSAIAVLSAVLCITRRSPVASALWLVGTLFALAGLFVLFDAQFIAVMQVLVYAGAIMVIFLFVIMLLNLGRDTATDIRGWPGRLVATVFGLGLIVELFGLTRALPDQSHVLPPGTVAQMAQAQGVVAVIAQPMFHDYLVPFEITSVLLLAAVVGAVVLAKRRL